MLVNKDMRNTVCRKEPGSETGFKIYLNRSRTVFMMVCICGKGPHGIYGRIVDFCQKEPEEFMGAREAVLKIEHIYRQSDAFTEKGPFQNSILEEGGWSSYSGIHGTRMILNVLVIGQHEGSLQGVVKGSVTGNRYTTFHSSLELIELLDHIEYGRGKGK